MILGKTNSDNISGVFGAGAVVIIVGAGSVIIIFGAGAVIINVGSGVVTVIVSTDAAIIIVGAVVLIIFVGSGAVILFIISAGAVNDMEVANTCVYNNISEENADINFISSGASENEYFIDLKKE